jgi:hypothetical protein
LEYKYRERVLNELARHGIIPHSDTPPEFVHEFVNDLYLLEIRRLRGRLKAGLLVKADYANHVAELRKRYPILSVPVSYWTEPR